MNLTALLLITLSGNGHWLGGHTETIEVQWAVKQPIPGATLAWRLVCGDAELASGRLALPAGNRPGIIRLALPPVRVQTAMHLIYRAEQAGKSAPLARGTAAVEVYPDDLLAGLAQRMAGKQLLVWDAADGLPAVLKGAKVKHTVIAGDAELQFVRPDVVLVGADAWASRRKGRRSCSIWPRRRQRDDFPPDAARFAGRLSSVAAALRRPRGPGRRTTPWPAIGGCGRPPTSGARPGRCSCRPTSRPWRSPGGRATSPANGLPPWMP